MPFKLVLFIKISLKKIFDKEPIDKNRFNQDFSTLQATRQCKTN